MPRGLLQVCGGVVLGRTMHDLAGTGYDPHVSWRSLSCPAAKAEVLS